MILNPKSCSGLCKRLINQAHNLLNIKNWAKKQKKN